MLEHRRPSPTPAERIALDLERQGYCVTPNFCSPELTLQLAQLAGGRWDEGDYDAARIGSGPSRHLNPSVRSDHIRWLGPEDDAPPLLAWRGALEELRLAINARLWLGLFDWEGHLAVYQPGCFYRRHRDVFVHQRERQVSTVLYLNTAWAPGDGGELRIFTPSEDGGEVWTDVPPLGGTLVTFLSEQVDHEVLLSHTDRFSLTGWFRRRPLS